MKYVKVVKGDNDPKVIAAKWRSEFFVNGKWRYGGEAVYNAIKNLGPGATPEQIDQIVGHKLCTHLVCHGCGAVELGLIQVGELTPHRAYCKQCIAEAYALATEEGCATVTICGDIRLGGEGPELVQTPVDIGEPGGTRTHDHRIKRAITHPR